MNNETMSSVKTAFYLVGGQVSRNHAKQSNSLALQWWIQKIVLGG